MAALSIASLPDDEIVCILGGLTLQERHTFAAPVCRRWRHLANSAPQLLRAVDATFEGGDERAAAKLSSFCAWMLTHAAQHVQRLSLQVKPSDGDGPLEDAPEGTPERLVAALTAALVGCGMTGGLSALWLESETALPLVWLHGLRRLRHLVVGVDNNLGYTDMTWDLPSPALPALQELALFSDFLTLPPTAHLPPSLTKLHLEALQAEDLRHPDTLPGQMAGLTRLHTLSLRGACCTSAGYDMLTRLPRLRRLELRDGMHWPACLSQLTGLEALALDNRRSGLGYYDEDVAEAALRHALPLLTRLTYLVLDSAPFMNYPPPELASLTRLHSFFWLGGTGPLPAGPWLSNLQRLAARGHTIETSAAVLAAAPKLSFLGVLCCDDSRLGRSVSAALLAPKLQRLVFYASKEALSCNLQALLRAQQRHPSVSLECEACEWEICARFWACCGYDPDAATSLDAFLAGES